LFLSTFDLKKKTVLKKYVMCYNDYYSIQYTMQFFIVHAKISPNVVYNDGL